MQKIIINLTITVILFVLIYFWLDESYWQTLLRARFKDILISCLLAISIYIIAGFQFYLTRKQLGASLKLVDIFLFPLVMGLWGFIFPFQGSVAFAALFFKKKYNMKISGGLSISIYLYLVTMVFTGLFGLIYSLIIDNVFSVLGIVSTLFLFNPLIVILLNRILLNLGKPNIFIIDKIHGFASAVIDSVSQFWQRLSFSLIIISITIGRILVQIVWFYYISNSLGFQLSFIEVTFISLIMNVSLILKFTPGNLGVAQLATGGFMALIGYQAEQAVIITLYSQAIMLMLVSTIGLYGNFHYFNTLNVLKLKKSSESR
jgi:uncharacterized membrane protein YbhN (UPF0104 family)